VPAVYKAVGAGRLGEWSIFRMVVKAHTNNHSSHAPPGEEANSVPSPLDGLVAAIADVRQHAAAYLETRRDLIAAKIRKGVLWGLFGLIAAFAGAIALGTAVVLLVVGAADGIGLALGHHYWAGKLIVGSVILAAVGIGGWRLIVLKTRTAFRRTTSKYEAVNHELNTRHT
jgi:hypothetical protein